MLKKIFIILGISTILLNYISCFNTNNSSGSNANNSSGSDIINSIEKHKISELANRVAYNNSRASSKTRAITSIDGFYSSFYIANNRVYYSESNHDSVKSVSINGGNIKSHFNESNIAGVSPSSLMVSKEKIYLLDSITNGKLYSIPIESQALEVLYDGYSEYFAHDMYNLIAGEKNLYFVYKGDNKTSRIKRILKDSSGETELSKNIYDVIEKDFNGIPAIIKDDEYLYVFESIKNKIKIHKYNLKTKVCINFTYDAPAYSPDEDIRISQIVQSEANIYIYISGTIIEFSKNNFKSKDFDHDGGLIKYHNNYLYLGSYQKIKRYNCTTGKITTLVTDQYFVYYTDTFTIHNGNLVWSSFYMNMADEKIQFNYIPLSGGETSTFAVINKNDGETYKFYNMRPKQLHIDDNVLYWKGKYSYYRTAFDIGLSKNEIEPDKLKSSINIGRNNFVSNEDSFYSSLWNKLYRIPKGANVIKEEVWPGNLVLDYWSTFMIKSKSTIYLFTDKGSGMNTGAQLFTISINNREIKNLSNNLPFNSVDVVRNSVLNKGRIYYIYNKAIHQIDENGECDEILNLSNDYSVLKALYSKGDTLYFGLKNYMGDGFLAMFNLETKELVKFDIPSMENFDLPGIEIYKDSSIEKIYVNNDYVYWLNSTNIFRMDLEINEVELIYSGKGLIKISGYDNYIIFQEYDKLMKINEAVKLTDNKSE